MRLSLEASDCLVSKNFNKDTIFCSVLLCPYLYCLLFRVILFFIECDIAQHDDWVCLQSQLTRSIMILRQLWVIA